MASVASTTSVAAPVCLGCRERDARIVELEKQLETLKAQNHKLAERARRNASNSSMPPSTNPPDAPKPTTKPPTGRKPGGQPGHPGHSRQRLPRERVQHVIPFVPITCANCQAPLPEAAGPNDPEPTWHQYAELPKVAAVVTEHQGHARTCTCCGKVTRASIPDELTCDIVGPRLGASRGQLQTRLNLLRKTMRAWLEEGTRCAESKTAAFCQNLLDIEPAL